MQRATEDLKEWIADIEFENERMKRSIERLRDSNEGWKEYAAHIEAQHDQTRRQVEDLERDKIYSLRCIDEFGEKFERLVATLYGDGQRNVQRDMQSNAHDTATPRESSGSKPEVNVDHSTTQDNGNVILDDNPKILKHRLARTSLMLKSRLQLSEWLFPEGFVGTTGAAPDIRALLVGYLEGCGISTAVNKLFVELFEIHVQPINGLAGTRYGRTNKGQFYISFQESGFAIGWERVTEALLELESPTGSERFLLTFNALREEQRPSGDEKRRFEPCLLGKGCH